MTIVSAKYDAYAEISTLVPSTLGTGAAYADAARRTATVAVAAVVSWTILNFL